MHAKMQASIVQTVTLPQISARDPVSVAFATDKACYVLIKNVSGAIVFVGFESSDVQGQSGPGSPSWQIQPANTDIFVLAAGQKLYAAANAPNALICVHVSEVPPRPL
jgi:hypothetical protein